jgi:hypothetical protein
MTFAGFDHAAVAMLDELPSCGRDELVAHERKLHDGVSGPGRASITALAAPLNGAVGPIGEIDPAA